MKLSWAEYRVHFNERLAYLKRASKIPFNSYLDPARVSYDLSVRNKCSCIKDRQDQDRGLAAEA